MSAPPRLGADPIGRLQTSVISVTSVVKNPTQPSVYSVFSVGTRPWFGMPSPFCDFCASLRPIFRAIFTTDYADSADISLLSGHP
jgi:hypothetical protein